MRSISQLKLGADTRPNSIEIQQALAEAYTTDGRWQEAVHAYRKLTSLYPDTAALFLDRIRLGAAALMIFSVLIFSGVLIRPSFMTAGLAEVLVSRGYITTQVLFTLGLALYPCSAISIYKLLSYTRDHRPAFWGMVCNVIGVGLSMPALGIKTFVYPLIGRAMLRGQSGALSIYESLNGFPLKVYLSLGDYLLVTGILIFAWVILRNRGLSLASILAFSIGWTGLAVSGHWTFGILAAIGGFWLGLSLWRQAGIQFDPHMDRTAKP